MKGDQAARYRAARGWAGLTQEQLADELGVDVQTVKRRESMRQADMRGANRAELLAMAQICKVPTNFMLYGWSEAIVGTPDAAVVEQIADQMRETARLLDQINAKLGPSIGRRDAQARRARGPRRELPGVAS